MMVCPYLPLKNPIRFGDYIVGPLSSLHDEWPDDDFKHLGMDLLESYRDPKGFPLSNPALISHRERGLDVPDAESVLPSMQAAIHFAVLDQNPVYEPKTQGWRVATSDNSTIHVWRLGRDGFVGTERGVIVPNIDFGWQASDPEFEVRPPLHLHMPFSVLLEEDVLNEVFAALSQSGEESPSLQRVLMANQMVCESVD